ncbi:MAG: hypothetical protein KZQ83_12975 [gamma proteobacterium symbiont of Taylorina sp.]|nr:hypothetical protein [gamma proteobacterium symbiont of Taylorina sp.]
MQTQPQQTDPSINHTNNQTIILSDDTFPCSDKPRFISPDNARQLVESLKQSRSNNPVKTIHEQIGWKRKQKETLLQDFNLLKNITEYDFDVTVQDFKDYCHARGVLQKMGNESRFDFTANHKATKAEFFVLFRYAKEYQGSSYRFTNKEMEIHWGIILAAKGSIQDCWEIYQNKLLENANHE